MAGFVAIVLVCASTVAADQCSEATATDVLSIGVANELGCVTGWQDIIARSALRQGVGTTAYVRTLCRRAGAPD